MTDRVFVSGLALHAFHGVMEHETEVGQRFVIDLELSADLSESSRTDRLADTVSYSNVVATASAAFKNANYKLLERAAGTIEGLSERVRQVTERLAEAESNAGRSRETEEMLQRTLLLAQKTADEAVADAQKRARQLLKLP